jgi:ribosomal protein S18 acetylase RimI-like enzyme
LLCINQTIPTPSSLNGKSGLLLNVYTIEGYRRRGIAKKLIGQLIDEARKKKLSKILLDYTDDGFSLYQSLGFQKLEREMCLYL